ncbi:MAG: autotransporter outer membrane beta-barrel domain-containing protein [Desulfovibrio sp.]|uniref:autotransporter outer membrane beta-barrel domain-containing protein n=1 Tax=Desulfovibrio sp. TaxID=885 RepID=UPI002A367335|nr:autotransporter outer membrane beta-barrel domain-containing protein [Desulfovibrio sp.]MDY0259003.1 autotransporter outer membrane beta-barrel domain-containing protein [Desulfovibrio sp.]
MLHHKLYVLPLALAALFFLLPLYGLAATVEYSSGTYDYVIGNPVNAGDSTGIGGTNLRATINNANASGNTVTVTGGTVNWIISGGYHRSNLVSAMAKDNWVEITNFTGSIYTNAIGGFADTTDYSSAIATGNSVLVRGGMFDSIVGGAASNIKGTALSGDNRVHVTGATVNDISGGRARAHAGTEAIATGNEAIVIDSTVTNDIYGGYAFASLGIARAVGNSVILSGGEVRCDIYGGFSGTRVGGWATGNSVTISGAPNLASSRIFGGFVKNVTDPHESIDEDDFSGNTLNIKTSGLTVRGLYNFQNINFYLPSSLAAGDTALTTTVEARLSENSDGTGRKATINVGVAGGAAPLKNGDHVVLIDAETLTGTPANSTVNSQGVALRYNFDILTQGNKLLATVTSSSVNPQAKALSEGFIGGMAMTLQGADLAAGKGMESAVQAASGAGENVLAGFGSLSGGSLRFNTGSHVDMRSLSLLTGLAWGADCTLGRFTAGPFFEYGNGSYNTANSFSNAADVDGNGNTYYLGGGLLARMDFTSTGPGHFYTEASGRAGSIHNKYDSSDLRDATGREAEYDSDTPYYGLHLGAGYIWNITDAASLDFYGKYFWTRQSGDSIRLSTGDPIDFDDVYSSRLRFGSRFAYLVNEYVSPYAGVAWEHEFDGKARASTNGYSMQAPSMRGDTGIGELGLLLKPSQTLPLSFDLGVQGYTGKREGVTGSLQARWEF